jgi:DNA-binding MarR family transcriptional regulator
LFLTPAARPLLEQLADLGEDMMATVLDGLDAKTVERTLRDLEHMRENLRATINRQPSPQEAAAS